MNERATGKGKDLSGARWTAWLLWGVPAVLLVGTGSIGLSSVGTSSIGNIIHTVVWTVCFAVAGVACLVNARRCGRLHCFYTGPLYLLVALASLLYGMGVLSLGHEGWNWIVGTAAVGTLLAIHGLERLLGKYRDSSAHSG